jgi:putative membrane protein
MAMGIAEVIPGVSGGTIAFITGIYERLLNAIKGVSPDRIKDWRQGGFRLFWEQLDGNFLLVLIGGMAIGLILGIYGVSHLLENYPPVIWAFFFGLILSSVWYIGKQVIWNFGAIILLLAGAGIAFWITIAAPAQGSDSSVFVFLSGMIAISALILPGISGSFILLLLGMYTVVVPSVKAFLDTFSTEPLRIVFVFGLGCLVGLASFSRVLSWTFRHYRSQTLAILTGFMLGSLNRIWPWRNTISWRTDSHGDRVPLEQVSVLPDQYDGETFLMGAILSLIVGILVVLGMDWWSSRKERPVKVAS